VSAYELEGDHASLGGLPYPSPEASGREVCRLYFLKYALLFGTPTSLLMRSEFVRSRNPFYEERHAPFEDFHVCFDALRTWNFGFIHQVLTYSRRDNESTLSRIRPFRFELFSRFATIVVHGKTFLSEQEYRTCYKVAERNYFYFLGWSVIHGKEAKFWEFHRQRLASIGYTLNSWFLAKWALIVLVDQLGNPKRTLEYLWERRNGFFSLVSRLIGVVRRPFSRKTFSDQL
jgi:hypothetical protein